MNWKKNFIFIDRVIVWSFLYVGIKFIYFVFFDIFFFSGDFGVSCYVDCYGEFCVF